MSTTDDGRNDTETHRLQRVYERIDEGRLPSNFGCGDNLFLSDGEHIAKTPYATPTYHTVWCPFCEKPVDGEPEFREHLRTGCPDAPREVDHSYSPEVTVG